MEKEEKKEYNAPEVVEYGDVVALTRHGQQQNSDSNGNNTACIGQFCSHPDDFLL